MVGTIAGGKKAAATNKKLHGEDFFARIGKKGGQNGHTGGFASRPELAREAGAKGGRNSKRGVSAKRQKIYDYLEANTNQVTEMRKLGLNCGQIARMFNLPYKAVYAWIRKKGVK